MSTELNFDLYQRSCASVCASCLLTQQHNDPRCVVYNLVLKIEIFSLSFLVFRLPKCQFCQVNFRRPEKFFVNSS